MQNPRNIFKYLLKLLKAAIIVWIILQLSMFGLKPIFFKQSPLTAPMQESVSYLKNTVYTLSQEIGDRNGTAYESLNKVAQFIEDSLSVYGYEVIRQNYTIEGRTYSNLIARSKNQDRNKEVVIVGAHYDSCLNPGADDNASGIAGVLELARLLKDEKSAHQIQFVAFTNEEPPYFSTVYMGSRVFTHRIHQDGIKVKGAIVFEMIGYYSENLFSQRYLPLIGLFYPNQGNFIAVVGDFSSSQLLGRVVHHFKGSSSFPIESIVAPGFLPGIYFSDHASFWKEGYPAIMVTDTAYLRNKNYHQMTDKIDTLNFEKMVQVVYGFKEAVLKFAGE